MGQMLIMTSVALLVMHLSWAGSQRPRTPIKVGVTSKQNSIVRIGKLLKGRWKRRQLQRAQDSWASHVIGLFIIALGSGANIHYAIREVAKAESGPFRRDMNRAIRRLDEGTSAGEVLQQLADNCPSLSQLVSTLHSSERYGSPVANILLQLANDVRQGRQLHAEREAKRLSVLLLIPLAVFTLPSFAVLTVAPLIVSALSTLTSVSVN